MPFDAGLDETDTRSRDLIILEKARAHIARGWCQGTWQVGDSFCIVGAIAEAVREIDRRSPGGLNCGHWCDLIGANAHWNDAPGRTQAEVLARFDTAIRTLTQAPRRCD